MRRSENKIMSKHPSIMDGFIVLALTLLALTDHCQGVGIDLKAKTRLMRDLPLGLNGFPENIPPRQTDKTIIDLSLAIRSIDLDFARGEFRTDGWMTLKWTDDRFEWNPANYEGIDMLTLPFSSVWAPEVILHNSLEERFAYRQVGFLKSSGEFMYILAVHSKSACEPNYEDFPFGLQWCQLKFGSWINEHYHVVEYRIQPNETVILEDFSSPAGWRMVATKAHLESKIHPLFEEPAHMVVFDLAFQRNFYFNPLTGELKRKSSDDRSNRSDYFPNYRRGDQDEIYQYY